MDEARVARTTFAFLFVPLLWPGAFIATAKLDPDAIDPLLGGLQNYLYVPALIWLLGAFAFTAVIAAVFRLRRTRRLFVMLAVIASVVLILAFDIMDIVGRLRSIGQHAVVYPDSVDDVLNWKALIQIGQGVIFACIVSLTTALAFVACGGLSLWVNREPRHP
ncbi:MAG: hypothetical protein ABL996_10990 [Micropepsaceae bacterium]